MLELLMTVVAMVLVVIFVTQILLPFLNVTPFFPIFHRSGMTKEVVKAEQELVETTELVHLKTRLGDAKTQLAQLKKDIT